MSERYSPQATGAQPVHPADDPEDLAIDDTQDLQRCLRELVALSALSAVWSRSDLPGIAGSLADILLRSLDVDLVYVRVQGADKESTHEAVRTTQGRHTAQEIGEALAPLLQAGGAGASPVLAKLAGGGPLRLAILPIGFSDCGFLVAGSQRPDFPKQTERLLISIGANQAAVVVQHKRAEEALKQSELRYRLVSQAAHDAIWDWDLTTGQVTWNEGVQTLFGYLPEQVDMDIAWWYERIHPEDRQRVVDGIHAIIDSRQESWSDEYHFLRADGSYAAIFNRGLVVHDAAGKPVRMIGSILDLTERRRTEAVLREADQRKDEFLAILSHELRNPLAPIRNSLQIMRQAGGNSRLMEKARDMIERQVQQMVRLVDDLLDVSRITRNKLELRKERIELAAVVESAVETSSPLIQASGHELTVRLPPEPVLLHADPTRLAQVLSNLLNNAAKYTEPGGRIWLTAERRGCEVAVSVRDTGIGIPARMLPKIFDMFIQVDHSLERTHGGLGIGLTLVQRLVELHGGTVEAASAGPGQGSEFTVRLPVLEEKPPPPQAPVPQTVRGAVDAMPRRRILVVDDNPDSADSLSMLLSLAGNEVRSAYDGMSALEEAAAFRPSVVLLDVGLPKLNGYEAARRIREQQGKDVVLIAVTGWGQAGDKRQAAAAGFDFHLVKPLDPAVLQHLLGSLEPPSK